MTIQNIQDSIYIVPLLLEYFEKPNKLTKQVLHQAGLTDDDIEKARSIEKMLRYHYSFIVRRVPDYPLLREGLTQYFDNYLSNIFSELGLIHMNTSMLDYGCGNGQYAHQFIKENYKSKAFLVDKDISGIRNKSKRMIPIQVDFEKEPKWFRQYTESFGVVLLSEVLHCKEKILQEYLIKSSVEMLAPGGKLIINENIDFAMQYRISKLKGKSFPLVTAAAIQELVENYPLKLENLITINNHNVFMYEKI